MTSPPSAPVVGTLIGPEPELPPLPPRRSRAGLVVPYLVAIFVLVTLNFVLPRALPGDPLRAYVDETTPMTPEQRVELLRFHGLDGPLVDQYRRYLLRLLQGDFGQSIASGQPVTRLLRDNLPWTVLLMSTALLLSSVLSFRAGVAAAWRRDTRLDRILQVASTSLRAVPDYALATFFLIVFGVLLGLFPISGATTPFTAASSLVYRVLDIIAHLVLPATALTLGLVGTKILLARNLTVGALGQDYMLLARAKGLPEQLLRRRHAGRNALLPFLNLIGVHVALAVAGAIFVETTFAYPGMGKLMVDAVNNQDYPVIEACFLVLSVLVLTTNLVVDLVGARLDPRVQAE